MAYARLREPCQTGDVGCGVRFQSTMTLCQLWPKYNCRGRRYRYEYSEGNRSNTRDGVAASTPVAIATPTGNIYLPLFSVVCVMTVEPFSSEGVNPTTLSREAI
jgi:hypothetical protein